MEIKKVCILDKIIEEANKHEIHDITCPRCKGNKKLDCYKEIQRGICYQCGGTGIVANKWKKILKEAIELKEAKTWLRNFYKEEYSRAITESRKSRILDTYNMRLNSLKTEAYELAKKAKID